MRWVRQLPSEHVWGTRDCNEAGLAPLNELESRIEIKPVSPFLLYTVPQDGWHHPQTASSVLIRVHRWLTPNPRLRSLRDLLFHPPQNFRPVGTGPTDVRTRRSRRQSGLPGVFFQLEVSHSCVLAILAVVLAGSRSNRLASSSKKSGSLKGS